jgi:uncharacterized protein (DUF1697 family)
MLCDGRDLLRIAEDNPFDAGPAPPGVVRFVTVLSKAGALDASLPLALPPGDDWLVRLVGSDGRFVFGEYRRHMKTIGYLGRIDKLYDSPGTTRNWNTVTAIVRILSAGAAAGRRR